MSTFLDTIRQDTVQDYILDIRGYADETTLEVRPEHILVVLDILKNKFGFNYLADMTASDHYTDEKRFEVSYNIVSHAHQQRLRVSCRVEEDQPELETAIGLWPGAAWHEREAYDMLGIVFRGHPDFRRMYLPEDFQFFPLRKEYPLLGIPGSISLPEKDGPKEYK
ncbi:MAG: NADH-quinone oxidoreductase subunit C [Bacteroidia bacterium]|nr:NADH-quinone oxidoreductase subunit C [Bacteroidia bacterium]